jgi:hypothetical protein
MFKHFYLSRKIIDINLPNRLRLRKIDYHKWLANRTNRTVKKHNFIPTEYLKIHNQQTYHALGKNTRITRIRIHMFLVLQDPDPDPLVTGMDPDPSIIMQK